MSKYIVFKPALVFSILVGIVAADCGPLASQGLAQRPSRDRDNDDERRGDGERGGDERGSDEGRNRWEGRRGWGGRRRGGGGFGGGEEGQRRGRERQRDEDDDEERDNDGNDEGGPRIEGWARNFVKENDKNGDMMLQEDEQKGLRGPVARADLDGDKVITVEEIVQSVSDRGASGRGQRERPSGRNNDDAASSGTNSKAETAAKKKRVYTSVMVGSDAGNEKDADKRKSYRFTPAQERLTGNLPSWFKSRDRNKDGQVSMSEYSQSWTARLVRQFQEVDLNDDGLVTAKEAAE